ncbi:hypothetical protein RCL1_002628 [Eukaryota sp. TZLM3-RCL]
MSIGHLHWFAVQATRDDSRIVYKLAESAIQWNSDTVDDFMKALHNSLLTFVSLRYCPRVLDTQFCAYTQYDDWSCGWRLVSSLYTLVKHNEQQAGLSSNLAWDYADMPMKSSNCTNFSVSCV